MASTHLNKASNPLQVLMAALPGKVAKGGPDETAALEFSDELVSLKGGKGKTTKKMILPSVDSHQAQAIAPDGLQPGAEKLPLAGEAATRRLDLPGLHKPGSRLSRAPVTSDTSNAPTSNTSTAGLAARTTPGAALQATKPGPALNVPKALDQELAAGATQTRQHQDRPAPLPRASVTEPTRAAAAGHKEGKPGLPASILPANTDAAGSQQPGTPAVKTATSSNAQPLVSNAAARPMDPATDSGLAHAGPNGPVTAEQAVQTSTDTTQPARQTRVRSTQTLAKPPRDGLAVQGTSTLSEPFNTAVRQPRRTSAELTGDPAQQNRATVLAQSGVTPASPGHGKIRQTDQVNATARPQATRRTPLAHRADPDMTSTARMVDSGQPAAAPATSAPVAGSGGISGQIAAPGSALPIPTSPAQATGHDVSATTTTLEPMDAGLNQPEFSEQLVDRVSVMLRGPLGQASIRLSPEELGPVRIELNVDGQQASLRISAAHPDTRAALDASLDDLRDHFSQEGLELRDARVSDERHAPDDNGASQRGMQQHREPGYARAADPADSAVRDAAVDQETDQTTARRPTDGRINLIA